MTASAADWSAFPELVLHPERVLYRVHRNQNDPVHFCSDGSGRFDLTAVDGTGTCYMSPSPIGAYIETFGRLGTITVSDIAERCLTELALTRPIRLADTTDRSVLGSYGITGDISAGTVYRPSQQAAAQLYAAGFDGVYYTARHDPAFQERSVAVFGGAGDTKLFVSASYDIPDELLRQGVREFHLAVLPDLH